MKVQLVSARNLRKRLFSSWFLFFGQTLEQSRAQFDGHQAATAAVVVVDVRAVSNERLDARNKGCLELFEPLRLLLKLNQLLSLNAT